MRLRISIGAASREATEGLRTLHSGPSIRVEGDEQVERIELAHGGQAFLAGRPIAVREPGGAMRPVKPSEVPAPSDADSCRRDWEGRFLVAIVGKNGDCDIASDRYCQRELYYELRPDGGAVFATDLSLVPGAVRPSGYDQVALAHAMVVYGFRPPKRHTYYKNVLRLGVNEQVRVRDHRATVVATPFRPQAAPPYTEQDLEKYSEMFIDSVRLRASSTGNVVSLSSGWDSTAILTCLVRLLGPKNVKAAIVRMQYSHRSGMINKFETDRAGAFAKHLGVDLRIVECDYRDRGPEWIEQLRPLLRSHQMTSITAIGRSIWCDAVARAGDGEAVFAGEISDGAHNLGFAQFATILDHPVLAFREYSDKMASFLFGPTFLRLMHEGRFESELVYNLLRGRAHGAKFDAPSEVPAERTLQLLASFFLRANRLPLYSLSNSRVLTKAGAEMYSAEMENVYLREAADAATPETLYAWYLHLYNSFHWQGSTVAGFSVMAEANGLRPALPFWDSRMQEFLSGMPEHWGRGLDFNHTKYPLKWTLEKKLDYPMALQEGPHSYQYDVDASFSHSAEILYASAYAPYLRDLLRERRYEAVLSGDVFDQAYLDGVVDRYVGGTEVRGAELSDLMALAMVASVGWYGQ